MQRLDRRFACGQSGEVGRMKSNSLRTPARISQFFSLLLFLLAVVVVAAVGGAITQTGIGSWYDGLAKPPWQPPSWAFAPVWSLLYVTIAVAGWLWWREGIAGITAVRWWSVQLALNLAWTGVFFGLQQTGWALATIVALDLAIVACVLVGWEIRRAASILFLPYLAWTIFASALNFAIVRLN
jgi:translocator protein